MTDVFLNHFESIDTDKQVLKINSKWQELEYEKINNSRYDIGNPGVSGWIVMNDSYHPLWRLERKQLDHFDSLPFYSAINGFYIEDGWRGLEIVFKGQEEFRWGLYFSALSALMLSIIFFYHKSED